MSEQMIKPERLCTKSPSDSNKSHAHKKFIKPLTPLSRKEKKHAKEENFNSEYIHPLNQLVTKSRRKKISANIHIHENIQNIFSLPPVELSSSALSTKLNIIPNQVKEISIPVVKNIKMQKDRGITHTNFVINSSKFDDIEINITMYDTRPFNFHIQLMGNEKIMNLTNKYQHTLISQIKNSVPDIRIHLSNPSLRQKDRFLNGKTRKNKNSIEKTSYNCYSQDNMEL